MLLLGSLSAQFDPAYSFVLQKAALADISGTTAAKGTLVYVTDNDKIYQFDGTNWVVAADADGDPSNELQALSYDPVTHIVTLSDGGTVDLSGLAPDTDWTISGNDQYSAVSGNVGVGNPTPNVKLDVTGDIHSTKTVNIGPNASGARLSIFDNGHTGSMLDIQTDDSGPLGFRLLNRSFDADLAKSFRMYQDNGGRVNMSVGDLNSNFFTIDPSFSNGKGSVGIGTGPSDNAMLYLNRGTTDVGSGHYFNQANRMVRTGSITNPATTIGLDNILAGATVGDSATYIGQRNIVYIQNGAYDFRSLTGSYSFAYNQSTTDNSDKYIYGSRAYAYDYGTSGIKGVYGGYFSARKQSGAGNAAYVMGLSSSASKADGAGNIDHAYGVSINASGASSTVRGLDVSTHTRNAVATSLYGANIRLYADSSYQAQNGYGLNINSAKYKAEITNNIYNINVNSTGYSSLANNYGGRFYLRGGINNFGLYVDVANGTGNNYAIFANDGDSFFRDKVGIGTSSPDEALHVAGNMRLNGSFEDKDGQAGTLGQVLSSTGAGTDWVDLSTLNVDDNDWSVAGNDLFSANSGKVGIGTNLPDQKLDVNGAAVIGSNNVNSVLDGQGSFQANSNLKDAGFVATPWVYARAIEGDQRGGSPTLITLGGQNGITNDDEIGFVTNGNQRMIIKPDGKVGVNTTIPKSELDVDGVLIEGRKTSMFGNYPARGSCAVTHGIASFFTNTTDNNYIHIKLPYKVDTDASMYRIHVTGYRYRSGKVIDLTWVGYCYSPSNALIETGTVNAGSPEFTMTQYVGSDKHIYLRFRGTTGSNYYQSFRVDSMHVGNGSILKEGDVQIISSASANL